MKEGQNEEPRIILASGSPRRKEILHAHGIDYEVIVSDVDESLDRLEEQLGRKCMPWEIVTELSRRKAMAVFETFDNINKSLMIIAADTLVACDEVVLGKPKDKKDAEHMISMIQGRAHQVYTGVTLLFAHPHNGGIEMNNFYEKTDVHVKEMTKEEIAEYVSTGESDDKAGAYAIQGIFGRYITGFEGDYENVVGLPGKRVTMEMKQMIKRGGMVE